MQEESKPFIFYDTIEHDMRHSKEYLANIKFNFVEVMHKYIFLKRLFKCEDPPLPPKKQQLVRRKEEVEELRKEMERASEEIAGIQALHEKVTETHSALKEKEKLLTRRVEEAQNKEKTIFSFSSIHKENLENLKRINHIRENITKKKENIYRIKKEIKERKEKTEKETGKRKETEEKLVFLKKESNQQIVYQYNWYKQFSSVYMQLVGAKVVDIQHTEQKASSLIYSSTEKDIPKVEEKKSKVTIKILAKKHNRTVIVTLVFLDSKLEGYAIYRTENNLQTAPESCDNLFSYCQRTNSTKYFLFKSIHQQLSTK